MTIPTLKGCGPPSPLVERVKGALGLSRTPMGVYALADLLTRATGQKHFPNSVYRVLQRLELDGDVLQVVAANGWVQRQPRSSGPVILCLCSDCGETRLLPADELDDPLHRLVEERRFSVTRFHLEMVGLCAACTAASAPPIARRGGTQQAEAGSR